MEGLEERLRAALNPELVDAVIVEGGRLWVQVRTPLRLSELNRLVVALRGLLELHGYRAEAFTLDGEVYLTTRLEKRQVPSYHA